VNFLDREVREELLCVMYGREVRITGGQIRGNCARKLRAGREDRKSVLTGQPCQSISIFAESMPQPENKSFAVNC
jgi:hypothetical protein